MAVIKRRKYKSKRKKIANALDRLYAVLGQIKHEYEMTDDSVNYTKMKADLLKMAEGASDISELSQDMLRTTPLKHY